MTRDGALPHRSGPDVPFDVRPVGDGALLVDCGDLTTALALHDALSRARDDGALDIDELVPAARTVLVGRDFRFGAGGAGDPGLLQRMGDEHGFRVDVVDDVRAVHADRRVSSTWIREALAAGDIATAAKLLGMVKGRLHRA